MWGERAAEQEPWETVGGDVGMHYGTARGYQALGCRVVLDGVAGVDELLYGYDVASELPNMTDNA